MSKIAQFPTKGNMKSDLPGSDGRRTFAWLGGRVRRTNVGVISFAPFMALAGFLSSTAALSLGTMVTSGFLAGEALAQCTTSGTITTCTGAITSKQTVTSTGSVTVNIDGSASIVNSATGNAQHALEVTGSTITIVQSATGSAITGGTGGNNAAANKSHAIKATSNTGNINITTRGVISSRGNGGEAIYAVARGNITVSAYGNVENAHQTGGRVITLSASGNISATLGTVRTSHTTSGQFGVRLNSRSANNTVYLKATTINTRRQALDIVNSTHTARGTGSVTVIGTTMSSRTGQVATIRNYGSGSTNLTVSTVNHIGHTWAAGIVQARGDVNVTISTINLTNGPLSGGNSAVGINVGPLLVNYLNASGSLLSSGTISVTVETINASTNPDFLGNSWGTRMRAKDATLSVNIKTITSRGTGALFRAKNISFTSTGSITSTSGAAIVSDTRVFGGAANTVKTRNITINVAAVSARNDAINIFNDHSHTSDDPAGFISITTTGVVTSTTSAGIVVQHSGTNVTVSTNANVTASTSGIYVQNYGTGIVNISASATVTSSGKAIYAYNKGTTTTVTAATVQGVNGVYVKHNGTGIATVKVTSATTTASGQTGKGAVYVYSVAGADVNVAAATGGRLIDIRNNSAGNVTLTSTATLNAPLPVFIKNTGPGTTTVTLSSVTTTMSGTDSIGAAYVYSKGGTNINITTVSGINRALVVKNSGASVATVSATNAQITTPGTPNYSSIGAVYVYSKGGTDVTVGTASGIDHAVMIKNSGTGVASATVATAIVGISGATAVHVESNAGTDVNVSAATGKELIRVLNTTSGTLTLTSTGTLNAASSGAVYAKNTGNGTTVVTLNTVSTPHSTSAAVEVYSKAGANVRVNTARGRAKAVVVRNSGNGVATVSVSNAIISATTEDGSGAVFVYSKGGTDVNLAAGTGGKLVHIHNTTAGTVRFSSTGALTALLPVYIRNTGNQSAHITLTSVTSTSSASTAKGAVFVYSKGGIVSNIGNATGSTKAITLNNSGVGQVSLTSTGTILANGVLGVSNSAQHAITINNQASTGTNVTVNANVVTGFISGIYATNSGSGAVSITVTGAITGSNGSAIYATNSGTTLTVNTSVAVNGRDGIVLKNNGTGLTSVDADGTITATGATPASKGALYIASKGGATVSTAIITGAKSAVNINNSGPGAVTFTATGALTSSGNQSGVIINNGSSTLSTGSNISVTTVAVSGSAAGIFAQNYGTGDLGITANGVINGVSGHGIFAKNLNGGSANITASANVTGSGNSSDGIHVTNGSGGTGIFVTTSSTISGGRKGIYTKNDGGGGTTITVSEKVTATVSTGIHAIDNGGGILTVSSTASDGISATGHTGIIAAKTGTGNVVIYVSGSISAVLGISSRNATSDTSITALGGITAGNSFPIFAVGGTSGAVNVLTSGTVSARSGIWAQGRGTNVTVSTETVVSRGQSDAINARNYGNGDTRVTTTGTITGGGTGIGVIAQGGNSVFITAQDTVTGSLNGILVNMRNAGSANITTYDDVTGSTYDGIQVINSLSTGTTVDIDASGDVTGARRGVSVENFGSGGVTIGVSGNILGTSEFGIRARNYTAGGLSITAEGNITGGWTGLVAVNSGDAATSITVSGNIISRNGHGVRLSDETNAAATVNISGTITSSGTDLTTSTAADGVTANLEGGNLTFSAQSVSGAGDGIVVKNTTNSGNQTFSISGAVTGSAGHGISITNETSGDFSITTSGNITAGAGHGVVASISSVSTVTVKSLGEIQANGTDFDAVNVTTEGGATLEITTSGGIISQEGSGIVLQSTGTGNVGVEVTTGSTGVVGSIGVGIHVQNAGGGSVTVDAKSLVTGRRTRTNANSITISNEGILIDNDASGANVTVSATAVTASGNAIHAKNLGVGSTSVATTGVILGGTDGIRAYAGSASATTLTVNAGSSVTGSSGVGIHAHNKGKGLLSVTTSGNITGGTGDGIYALSDGGDVTVSTNAIRGEVDGIEAYSKAGGTVQVVASGTVTGRTGTGVKAIGAGGSVSVTGTTVSGGITGVHSKNTGIGAVTINFTGAVRGLGMDGIYAYNSSAGTNLTITTSGSVTGGSNGTEADKDDGKSQGIEVINQGSGTTSVTVRGAITGGNHGILLSNSGTEATLIAGTVSSANHGIKFDNLGSGATSLTLTGNVTGTRKHGISVTGGSGVTTLSVITRGVTAGEDGINLSHSGTDATVTVSGSISAGKSGLILAATGQSGLATISVTGNIVAGGDGLKVSTVSDGNISVSNIGNINASGNALQISTTGDGNVTLTFSGTITASGAGLHVVGTSSATTESGNNISVSTTGGITTTRTALHVSNSGANGVTTVVVSGSLVSSESHGLVAVGRGKNVSVTSAGDVSAEENAVDVTNSGTGATVLAVSGSVNGGAAGILVKGASSSLGVTVTTGKTVTGGTVGLLVDHKGSGAVVLTASDDVTGAGRVANSNKRGVDVYLGSSGTTATLTLSSVTGSGDGVKVQNKGSGVTTVSANISGSITGTGGYGLSLYGNTGQIMVTAGDVTGAKGGVHIVAKTGSVSVTVNEVNSSESSGISISAAGVGVTSVTTSGAVTGLINGIDIRRSGTPTSSGQSNDINIVTSDDVTGQGVPAVTGSGTTPSSDARPGSGIYARHTGRGDINITILSGEIKGGNGGLPIDADAVNGVTNINLGSGAVIGTSGSVAILHSAGNSVVTVNPGSTIRGNIQLGGGRDILRLQGGIIDDNAVLDGGNDAAINSSVDTVIFAPVAGTTNQIARTKIIGSNLQNWERIVVESNAQMVISGQQSLVTQEFSNLGSLDFTDDEPDDVLSITGNYVGGGIIYIDANFATEKADRLTINGDVIGVTEIRITDKTGNALATGRDFWVINVDGTVNPKAFELKRAKRVDGIDYNLVFDEGSKAFILTVGIGNPLDIDTMLVATPAALSRTFANAPSMMQRRQGLLPWTNEGESQDGTWMRYFGATNDHGLVGTGGSFQSDQTVFQYGYDLLAFDFGNGGWSVGITAQTGTVTANAEGAGGVGTIEAQGYGIGTTATWFGRDGSYLDLQGQINFIETEFANIRHGSLTEPQKSESWVASMELGRRIHLGGGLSVIPQGQLSVGQIAGSEFVTDRGNKLGYDSHLSLNARFGVAAEYFGDRSRGYVVGNFLHNFSDKWEVSVDEFSVNDKISPSAIEFGIGGSVASTTSTTLFIEASYRLGVGGEEGSQESSAMLATGVQWSW